MRVDTEDGRYFLKLAIYGLAGNSRIPAYPSVSMWNMPPFIFSKDAGGMWLSYNDKNKEEAAFIAGGEEWKQDVNAAIALSDAYLCIREFLNTYERPTCIQWQEL